MSKFLKDILRDKNSRKYSITKSLAVLFALAFVILLFIGVILERPTDHILMGEILLAILTLTGFKNNFGAREKKVVSPKITPQTTLSNDNDEGEF
jgi:hypothetical protein